MLHGKEEKNNEDGRFVCLSNPSLFTPLCGTKNALATGLNLNFNPRENLWLLQSVSE